MGLHGILRFDKGDQIVEQVFVELAKGGSRRHGIGAGAIIRLRASIRHHDDHRHGLFVREEVVQNDLRMAASAPFSFVAADAVKEIQDGIFRVGRIARRGIDERLALVADGFGIVFNHL